MPAAAPSTAQRQLAGFYPIGLALAGLPVLVVGGHETAFAEITKLVDFGAVVHVVAPFVMAEINELAVTYGDSVTVFRRAIGSEEEVRIKNREYALVLAVSNDPAQNVRALQQARAADVLVFADCPHAPNADLQSSFVLPTALKRGHLKISVSSDGISKATERALLQRIEATLVNDIDRFVLFLTKMKDRIESVLGTQKSGSTGGSNLPSVTEVIHRLQESDELYLALGRQNFDEANQIADKIIQEFVSGSK